MLLRWWWWGSILVIIINSNVNFLYSWVLFCFILQRTTADSLLTLSKVLTGTFLSYCYCLLLKEYALYCVVLLFYLNAKKRKNHLPFFCLIVKIIDRIIMEWNSVWMKLVLICVFLNLGEKESSYSVVLVIIVVGGLSKLKSMMWHKTILKKRE